MITAQMARDVANDMRMKHDWYASINDNRKGMRCHYYQVNDYVCFEFWNKNEYEFTVGLPENDERRTDYLAVIVSMNAYMHNINVTLTKVPDLLARVKARLDSIDKTVA